MSNTSTRYTILWFFLGLFLISIFLIVKLLWPFISIMVSAAVVTAIFNPVYGFFSKIMRPHYASLVTCILIFFILFVPIALCVGILSKEASDLIVMAKNSAVRDQLKNLIENSSVIEKINHLLVRFDLQKISIATLIEPFSQMGQYIGGFIFNQARAIASNVFSFVVSFFFMLLIVFYLFVDGKRLVIFMTDLSPLPEDQDEKLIEKFEDMSVAILLGNGFSAVIQGIFGGIAFQLLSVGSPFIWGLVMTFLAFLPIVGIGAVLLPAAVYLFLKGQIGAGIFLIVFYVILSGGMEYFVKPKLVGDRVKMHTLVVFLSIMGGLKLFGIMGIVYGPLVMTIFLTLTDIYHSSYQNMVEPEEGKHLS